MLPRSVAVLPCHLGWRTLLKCNKTNHACLVFASTIHTTNAFVHAHASKDCTCTMMPLTNPTYLDAQACKFLKDDVSPDTMMRLVAKRQQRAAEVEPALESLLQLLASTQDFELRQAALKMLSSAQVYMLGVYRMCLGLSAGCVFGCVVDLCSVTCSSTRVLSLTQN
jgi:hypothetical protein